MKKFVILFLVLLSFSLNAQDTWIKTYQPGGSNGSSYDVSKIKVSLDGGYVVNGSNNNSIEPSPDYRSGFLFKTDSLGNFLWSQEFGFNHLGYNYWSTCFIQNDFGKYIASQVHIGYQNEVFYLRISDSGNIEEEIIVNNFIPYSMTKISNIYVGGQSIGYPAIQVLSQNGLVQQTMSINFNNNQYEGKINSIIALDDSFLLCTGYIQIPQNDFVNAFITKIDINGNEIWSNILLIFSSIGYSAVHNNQNILITGSCSNNNLNGFLWLLDYDGNIIWQNYKINPQYSSIRLDQNNFLISDPNLYCIDGNCNLLWESDFHVGGVEKNIDISNNEFIIFPGTYYYSSYVTITKTDLQGQVSAQDNQTSVLNYDLNNFPNPFNPSTTIDFSIQNDSHVELDIYNIKGQKIKTLLTQQIELGSHSIIWNGDDEFNKSVSTGVYYYQLKVNGKTEAINKCLLLK